MIKITAERRKDFLDEKFLSKRDKLVRLNRSKQDFRTRFVSPENRIGTQLRPLRDITRIDDEFKVRPETEKAHKRVMSSGLGISKQSTGAPTKVIKGFEISGRTVYGKHTPGNFSNFSAGMQTPAPEYADESKVWIQKQKQNRLKEDIETKSKIAKVREIERIMKRLGKVEQERNITVFKKLIKEEKDLHKELLELDKNQREKELLRKRYLVFRSSKRRSLAKVDREFALSFAQHKNIIAKHASIGEKRRRENEYLESQVKKHEKSKIIHHAKNISDGSATSGRSFIKSQRY